MKKLIFFDAMGVIFKTCDDVRDLLYPYLQNFDESIEFNKVKKEYFIISLGKVNSEEFFKSMIPKRIFAGIDKDYLDSNLELDEDFNKIDEKLIPDYDLALLSNDSSQWSKYLRKKFDIDKYFIEAIISSDVGVRKPSIEIFKIALKKTNRIATDCIFIDDNIKNLMAAASLGIKTIWFNRNRSHYRYSGISVKSMAKLIPAIKSLS